LQSCQANPEPAWPLQTSGYGEDLLRILRAEALGQGHQGSKFRRDQEISMRVLVLGGGQIAKAVGAAAAPAQHEVAICTHAELSGHSLQKSIVRVLMQYQGNV
jgi:hypothetical protein